MSCQECREKYRAIIVYYVYLSCIGSATIQNLDDDVLNDDGDAAIGKSTSLSRLHFMNKLLCYLVYYVIFNLTLPSS